MGDGEISEYGEVFDLSIQLICINSSSSYFFKVFREGYEVYYNDDKGDVKDYSLKMIKKLSFDNKEKYRQDITNAFNDFVHKEVERKSENQPIHSLFVKNVMDFFLKFLDTLSNDINDDFYSTDETKFSEIKKMEEDSQKSPDKINDEMSSEKNFLAKYLVNGSNVVSNKNVILDNTDDYIEQQEKILLTQLRKIPVIEKRMVKSENRMKYIASVKLPEIWRSIIDLIESKVVTYPSRENIGDFIKKNIVNDDEKEFDENNIRQVKYRDETNSLFPKKISDIN
ncbi:hypothetical protein AGMMS49546_28220 [Spirochaetia bacterium]|nr:hypothetical protein AGMMS49546_28220 [Spirochaetia bacterium]